MRERRIGLMRGVMAGVILGVVAWFGEVAVGQEAYARLAPFDRIEVVDEGPPRIRVGSEWYRWLAIDGVEVERVRALVVGAGEDPEKRLGEDLVEWMDRFGQPLGETVTLLVRTDVEPGAVMQPMPEELVVAMTATNREAVMVARNEAWTEGVDAERVLAEVAELIEARHAYARLRGVDVRAEADRILEEFGEGPGTEEVVLGVRRLVAQLGDGHAGVRGWRDAIPAGWLPFQLESSEEGVVARLSDRSGFVDEGRPFVVAIDGVPLTEWLGAAQDYAVNGSAALEHFRGLRYSAAVNLVRERLGLARSGVVSVTLAGVGGTDATVREFALLDLAQPRVRRERVAEALDGDVLRVVLETMSLRDDDLAWLDEQLDRAAEMNGLVLDVRGNGGGRRDATRAVLERLVHRVDGGARVVNAARPWVWADHATRQEDYLANRSLYPVGWAGWTDPERSAIADFAKGFEPSWAPWEDGDGAEEAWGPWSYFVVSERAGAARIECPVVVLMDEGCFSATDIFLGALKGVPGVRLVGTASGGGSARTRRHRVWSLGEREGEGVEIGLASMASFMPDGRPYDGNGVAPDVVVERTAACTVGRSDVQLERGLEVLRAGMAEGS